MPDEQNNELLDEPKEMTGPPKKRFPLWVVFIAVAVILIGLAATPAWDYVYSLINGETKGIAQLRVYAPDSTLAVYIDDEFVGRTSEGMLLLSDVSAEEHEIRLEREASTPGFYAPFERELVFMESAEVEIQWLAGPTPETSEGVLKYFRQRPEAESALRVFFVVYPDGATVKMDDAEVDKAALSVAITDVFKHEISVEKEGYESKEFTVDAGLFGEVNNADLVVEVYLYQSPVVINDEATDSP